MACSNLSGISPDRIKLDDFKNKCLVKLYDLNNKKKFEK